MKTKRLACLLTALTALSSITLGEVSAPSAYKLDVDESAGQNVRLNLPDDGVVGVTFIRNPGSSVQGAGRLQLSLLPFHNDAGVELKATLVEPSDANAIDPSANLVRARIALPANLPAGTYRGALMLSGQGGEVFFRKIELVRPSLASAVLVAAQQAVTIDYSRARRWLLWGEERGEGHYTVELREKGGMKPISNITWRYEQAPKAPNGLFDPKRSFDVKIVPSTKPFTSDADITVKGLRPGEYMFYLRFMSPDSAADDLQKVTVTVHVKSSWMSALAWLVVGLGFSFLGTKFVGYLRSRAQLMEQIRALERCWGTGLHSVIPSALSVAWVRSIIEQARDYSSHFSFTAIDTLKRRLVAAERIVVTLDEIEDLLQGIRKLPPLQAYRAQLEITKVLERIDPRSFNDAVAARCKADIASLREWLDQDKGLKRYRDRLKANYGALVADITAGNLQSASPSVSRLVEFYQKHAEPPEDTDLLRQYDENYSRLKILYEYRHWNDAFAKLSDFELQHPLLAEFFEFTDELGWEILAAACGSGAVQIEQTVLGGSGELEAYQPLLFEFVTHDRILNELFVVRHGCEYHWKLWRDRPRWLATLPPKVYELDTAAPMLVDYPDGPGVLHVELTVKRKGKTASPIPITVGAVQRSAEFKALAVMEWAEVLSFVVVLVLSIVGGLATYYVNNPVFGSMSDYVSLFLTAAGVDQGKNALQMIQSWKPGMGEGGSSIPLTSAPAR